MARIKTSIGLRRIPKPTRPSIAGATRDVRKQMKVIRSNIEAVINSVEGATPQAVRDGLRPIFFESLKLSPIDKGDLRRSGFLNVTEKSGEVFGEIGYAKGGDPFYAVFVHENLAFFHKAPTQAKFLEEAVNRKIGGLKRRIMKSLREATGIS